jgi:alpha-L-rhamnosidase
MINQLHKNVLWSIYGNFFSLPTDCPQRDERLGWTGDIQVFANTANYFFDTAGFLDGWLRDVQAETLEYDGVCPEVVPWMYSPYQDPERKVRPMGIWADCTALTPWDLYSFFGDKELLRRNWTSMTAWLERGVPRGSAGLYSHDAVQFGDWLDPRAPPQYPAHGQTDIHLSCDAFLVYTTQVVAQIARILGEPSAGKWADEYEQLKRAFQQEYITPKGRCMSDTQTALALALKFGLFPEELKGRAVERIDRLVRWDAFRISTGFAGTPLILNALAENGLLPTAYRMLQEGENPSWLYPVSMGATTIVSGAGRAVI